MSVLCSYFLVLAPPLSLSLGRHAYTMKTMLITLAVVIAAGAAGFWTGCYRTRKAWERSSEIMVRQAHHYANWSRAMTNTKVLGYLAEGKQAEARAILERQLDVALIGVVAYEKTYSRDGGRGGIELGVVREARSYRSQHPWRPEENEAAQLQEAFKWAQ